MNLNNGSNLSAYVRNVCKQYVLAYDDIDICRSWRISSRTTMLDETGRRSNIAAHLSCMVPAGMLT